MEQHTAADILVRNAWYVAGWPSDFEQNQLKQMVIAERVMVFWRTPDDQVVAFDDRCTHKRMPLSAGRVLDGAIECGYHGMCFDSSGACTSIPSQPGAPIPDRAGLRSYPVRESDGLVWVWTGDSDPADTSPPGTPELVNGEWEWFTCEFEVAANSTLMIENLLDTTHFYPLHAKTIGQASDSTAQLDGVTVEESLVGGLPYVAISRETDDYTQTDNFGDVLGHSFADIYAIATMSGPAGVIASRVAWPAGQRGEDDVMRCFKTMHLCSPISRSRHHYRFIFLVPKGQPSGKDPSVSSLERAEPLLMSVLPEDIDALEMQQAMFDLPSDDFTPVTLRADQAIRKAVRALIALESKDGASA